MSAPDDNIYGPAREIPQNLVQFETVTGTFFCNVDMSEKIFFEEWQKQAFDETSWDVGYYNDYVSLVDIYLLDRLDNRRFGLRLWEAFPKTITGTELNQGSNNEIIKTSVSFSFRYFRFNSIFFRFDFYNHFSYFTICSLHFYIEICKI